MKPALRKACPEDIDAVERIYLAIHEMERLGKAVIGWDPKVYPIRATAERALQQGWLWVMIEGGDIVASAIINSVQPEAYKGVVWSFPAEDSKVGVLHTLVVRPDCSGRGLGKRFVALFEEYCRAQGLEVVRLDTQVKNRGPYAMYPRLGYRLAAITDTPFEGLPATVRLALFEKKL